jgi:hypothetical protein
MAAIAAQRGQRSRIVVPEVVAGEAFTKLRHDRRVSGRHDARAALTVFGLLAADSELFELRGMPDESYRRSGELLATYVDQDLSWVDAIVLLCADDDREVDGLWTVDTRLAVYRFSHQIALASPA